jgi:putative Mn2+ efflux pump MntP
LGQSDAALGGLIQVLRADPEAAGPLAGQQQQLGRLLVTGIALSIDNLAVGFTLGTYRVSLPVTMASDSTRIRRIRPRMERALGH